MADLIQKALSALRESKRIEFKQSFDIDSAGEWCEIIKDLVAIANSGGGIIVFGLDSRGATTGQPVDRILAEDSANIGNRLRKYVGAVDLLFEIVELKKDRQQLAAFLIEPVSIPIIFQNPGTYGDGKNQKTAFGRGTVYFRHGAKSEPGSSEDIRQAIERQLEVVRRSWVKGVRRVVEAPPGTQLVSVSTVGRGPTTSLASTVRAVKDANAIPVRLTRDRSAAIGNFVHEEISDGIFDEINNVIDANRALAKGRLQFLLGQAVYYRIYAERQHVIQRPEDLGLLFHCAVMNIYAPSKFWLFALPESVLVDTFAQLYFNPISPQIHDLMRFAVMLGPDFCNWLHGRWNKKWKSHPQPPAFTRTFKEMIAKVQTVDPRLVAVRMSPTTVISVAGETPVLAKDLLADPELAAALLSKVCMRAFEDREDASASRSLARHLDYFAYGQAISSKASQLSARLIEKIGDRMSGDVVDEVHQA